MRGFLALALQHGGVIGGVVSAFSSAVTQKMFTGEVNWKSVAVAGVSGFVGGAIAASPLGVAGQQVAGDILGGASYVANAYVNGTAITADELMCSVGMGYLSGKIGGAGANHKLTLSNTMKSTKYVIQREARRANQKYAQKAVAKALYEQSDVLGHAASTSIIRFIVGTEAANKGKAIYKELGISKFMPSVYLR